MNSLFPRLNWEIVLKAFLHLWRPIWTIYLINIHKQKNIIILNSLQYAFLKALDAYFSIITPEELLCLLFMNA